MSPSAIDSPPHAPPTANDLFRARMSFAERHMAAASNQPRMPPPPLSAFGASGNASSSPSSQGLGSQNSSPAPNSDGPAAGGPDMSGSPRRRAWGPELPGGRGFRGRPGSETSADRPRSEGGYAVGALHRMFASSALQDDMRQTRIYTPDQVARLERERRDRAIRYGLPLSQVGDTSSFDGRSASDSGSISNSTSGHQSRPDTRSDIASVSQWGPGASASGDSEAEYSGNGLIPLEDLRRSGRFPRQSSRAPFGDEDLDGPTENGARGRAMGFYRQTRRFGSRDDEPYAESMGGTAGLYSDYRTASAPPGTFGPSLVPRSTPDSAFSSRPPSRLTTETPSQTRSPSRAVYSE